jgi:hypothetical protein
MKWKAQSEAKLVEKASLDAPRRILFELKYEEILHGIFARSLAE